MAKITWKGQPPKGKWELKNEVRYALRADGVWLRQFRIIGEWEDWTICKHTLPTEQDLLDRGFKRIG